MNEKQKQDAISKILVACLDCFQQARNCVENPTVFMTIPKPAYLSLVAKFEPVTEEYGHPLMALKHLLQVHYCLSNGYHITHAEWKTYLELVRMEARVLRREMEEGMSILGRLRKAVQAMQTPTTDAEG